MNVRSNCLFSSRRAPCSVSLCYFAEIYNSTAVYLECTCRYEKFERLLDKISAPVRSTVAKSRGVVKTLVPPCMCQVYVLSCFTDYGFYYLGSLLFFRMVQGALRVALMNNSAHCALSDPAFSSRTAARSRGWFSTWSVDEQPRAEQEEPAIANARLGRPRRGDSGLPCRRKMQKEKETRKRKSPRRKVRV